MTAASWVLASNGDAATTTADLTKQKQLINEADALHEHLNELADSYTGAIRQKTVRLSYLAWQRSARRFNFVGKMLERLDAQANAELAADVPTCPACGGEGGEDCATADPMMSVYVVCEACAGSGEDYSAAPQERAA